MHVIMCHRKGRFEFRSILTISTVMLSWSAIQRCPHVKICCWCDHLGSVVFTHLTILIGLLSSVIQIPSLIAHFACFGLSQAQLEWIDNFENSIKHCSAHKRFRVVSVCALERSNAGVVLSRLGRTSSLLRCDATCTSSCATERGGLSFDRF